MSDASTWLERYQRDHTHPVNKATHMVGIPMIVISLGAWLVSWRAAVALFVVGWILQFIGHAFEGKKPSFMGDPRFLLVGPMWYLQRIVGRIRGTSAPPDA